MGFFPKRSERRKGEDPQDCSMTLLSTEKPPRYGCKATQMPASAARPRNEDNDVIPWKVYIRGDLLISSLILLLTNPTFLQFDLKWQKFLLKNSADQVQMMSRFPQSWSHQSATRRHQPGWMRHRASSLKDANGPLQHS
jgi:hypothetical protein